MNIIIATTKSWNIDNAKVFKLKNKNHNIKIITDNEAFLISEIKNFKPDYIFFPHWSWIIDKNIYENFNCIVFHMTDLPFGRGGSPLQNLIARGIENTKISAIKVEKGIDTGAIYIKENLSLEGSAKEIFKRASDIIFNKMMPVLINDEIEPVEQQGEIVRFNRRSKEDGQIKQDLELNQIYDYIRMLDAEGYPNAFLKLGEYVFEFKSANFNGLEIEAKVKIYKEADDE